MLACPRRYERSLPSFKCSCRCHRVPEIVPCFLRYPVTPNLSMMYFLTMFLYLRMNEVCRDNEVQVNSVHGIQKVITPQPMGG